MLSPTRAMACAIHSLQVFSSAQINVFTEEVVLRLDIVTPFKIDQNKKKKKKSLNR